MKDKKSARQFLKKKIRANLKSLQRDGWRGKVISFPPSAVERIRAIVLKELSQPLDLAEPFMEAYRETYDMLHQGVVKQHADVQQVDLDDDVATLCKQLDVRFADNDYDEWNMRD